jgi:aerobic-type carbon monoxide dehydrogenase small subunit (CoxS/CutS family)
MGKRSRLRPIRGFTRLIFCVEQFELSSPRVGCEHGVCGACTIRVDGQIIRGCLMLSMQLDGTEVDTLEGLTAAVRSPTYRKPLWRVMPFNAASAPAECC